MRENRLLLKRHRRYVITTNSDHESPIFSDLARDHRWRSPERIAKAAAALRGRKCPAPSAGVRIAGHGRARLRTTHKANGLLTRAGVIANHAEQAAGGQRGSERVHTA
jgi:hypothetical protein